MSKNSIFQLRKTKVSDKTNVQIRTVNFESEEIENIDTQNYFKSRIKFLGASYDFAKEAKLNDDFDFEEGPETKSKGKSAVADDDDDDFFNDIN